MDPLGLRQILSESACHRGFEGLCTPGAQWLYRSRQVIAHEADWYPTRIDPYSYHVKQDPTRLDRELAVAS